MTISILKAVLVILILAVMILLLLLINHFFTGNFTSDEEETNRFRDEIREMDEVITGHNIFHDLVQVRKNNPSAKNA